MPLRSIASAKVGDSHSFIKMLVKITSQNQKFGFKIYLAIGFSLLTHSQTTSDL